MSFYLVSKASPTRLFGVVKTKENHSAGGIFTFGDTIISQFRVNFKLTAPRAMAFSRQEMSLRAAVFVGSVAVSLPAGFGGG
ncbi:MAG: hypothetical protein ROW48_12980 [Bellilinea sp.]|jgi:hypothetical protein